MNEWNRFKVILSRVGALLGSSRMQTQSFVALICALSVAFYGCSAKGDKKTVVAPPEVINKPDTKVVLSTVDSLVKANKGKGKGIITGFLTGENKSIASGILGKIGANAAGERRLLTKSEIPLTGATILVFNALKPTTVPDTSLKTDTTGNYTCVLPEGKYFGFAVYLDLETFQLVTSSIPNMNPIADSAVKMDTAIAIEDVTAPTVTGVYDAGSANSDGIFLVGSVADKGAKLNITFSEPMNRESSKGVILGRIDTSNTSTSMVLADTLKGITLSWSGDSKELTLTLPTLATGNQYGLIMPVSLKDLAKNPLEKEYKATFVTVATADLEAEPFSVTSTFPEDKGSIKPIQNPGLSFSRPVEAFSILKNAKIAPEVKGYFEVSGARAVFIHKEPLKVGTTYTISLPINVVDLSGASLDKAVAYSFTVKDFEGAAKENTGRGKEVALTVETAFDAYLSGDVGRFGAYFHTNFRMYNEDGALKSKTEFLDMIRKDVGDRQSQSAGFMGPVFDNSADACKDGGNANRWKVAAEGGTAEDQIWVDAYVSPGQSPRAYGLDKSEIKATELTWDPTGPRFTYKGKKYGFGPDMSKFRGPVNMDAAKNDMRFMGDLLKQSSTVVLEDVKLESKDEFHVDANVTINVDTAKLAVKMIGYRKFNRNNFGDMRQACSGALADTSYEILKFTVVFDGAKWQITSIVSPSKETKKEDFNKAVDTKDFGVKTMLPITLLSPLKDNGMGADGKITFNFNGLKHDSVGGYIVGISEDGKFCFGRPPFGALVFVKSSGKEGAKESFTLNSAGGVEGTNAIAILRRAHDLKLPGWERTMFENPLTKIYDVATGFGGVYNWKVIAVKDTSAVQFLANGFNPGRYYGESDFGPARGYFACKNFPQGDAAFNQLQNNQQKFVNNQPLNNNAGSFSDMDQDGIPDQMEINYKTDPRNRNSTPDFRVDTDGDALADFLEALLDPKGTDSLVTKKADEAGVKAEIAALLKLGINWQDSDADGFPDDVEMMSGFNPKDAKNNPGTRPRANAPVGVFAGKFQMGSNMNSVTFKLFTDSTKLLWVAYTVVLGQDTLIDTVRAQFNEISGDVMVPIALSLNGPDAGRALLLRGHYDAIQSLLMGPVDMIPVVAKTSTNFGGGPYVGQFAASGRGEDVSRFLGGGNGSGSGSGAGPGNPMGPAMNPATASYRLPPAGTREGSLIILEEGVVTLVDDFGDTLAFIENLNFRSQPDGSYEFFGEKKTKIGMAYKRSEVGGRISRDPTGTWIMDGHFFQESDSNGIHKNIPGQLNAKGAKGEIASSPKGIVGTFKGWIAQDKTGNGFAAQPGSNPNTCDPAKGPCGPATTCDPAKGPCGPAMPCDPSKGPCGTNPNPNPNPGPGPINSFSKPYMSGATNFKMHLDKQGLKEGTYIFVQIGTNIYKVKNDSTGIMDAKFPMCGQVVLMPELLDMKEESEASRNVRMMDSMRLSTVKGTYFFLMEDQFAAGVPQRLDKARDGYGNIVTNVMVAEMRLIGADYGTSSMVCKTGSNPPPMNPPPMNPPPCDPAKPECKQPPCDSTKGPCGPVIMPPPPCDPTKPECKQPPCDSTKGPCGSVVLPPPPSGGDTSKPAFYKGPIANIMTVLSEKGNAVKVMKAPGIFYDTKLDPASVKLDGGVTVATEPGMPTMLFIFLGDKMDPTKPMVSSTNALVVMPKGALGNPPPSGNPPPIVNPPDTTKPQVQLYKGTIALLKTSLELKGFAVKVMSPSGLIEAKVNESSVVLEGDLVMAMDATSSIKVYVFMGDKLDPTKPAQTPEGFVLVKAK